MNCLFCNYDKSEYIAENELAFAIYDKFPVNEGHVLVIPKRHFQSFFDVTDEELIKINHLIKQVKGILDNKFKPDGYNVGINVGEYGGQTIMHLHVHIIPRYKGDIENPRGGIRKIKKQLVEYDG
ncbi:HIT family protein [Clostridium frigidicarnis]|uniref:Diadenosine tetraphosphate (Ap4A) hydrolase n=1 Tax=Clostridium frigidicarnis TaxID=84698 RepID=A0A1I0YD91_9CLOT|nr:HIT family protein [Clostridium frigidicarnis]SFB11335.1 Diadenosine tetraphosphate (Ap4A) hydrolase [Clostridium frigidicarnis]